MVDYRCATVLPASTLHGVDGIRVLMQFALIDRPEKMSVLSAAEQSAFDLIISAGRDSGWLSVASAVTVEANQSEVSIRIVTEDVQRLFVYVRNEQWPYVFLRELVEQRHLHDVPA